MSTDDNDFLYTYRAINRVYCRKYGQMHGLGEKEVYEMMDGMRFGLDMVAEDRDEMVADAIYKRLGNGD